MKNLFLVVSFLLLSESVWAVCAPKTSAKTELQNSSAVFLGTVSAVEKLKSPIEIWKGNTAQASIIDFKVEKYWKGNLGKTFSLHTYSADKRFSKGSKLLIYARDYGEKSLTGVFDCNEPIPYELALKTDLKELGAGKRPQRHGRRD